MNDFSSLNDKASLYGESGDCVVKAIALALGTSYEDAYNLAAENGRKPHGGLAKEKYFPAIESRGAKIRCLFERHRIIKSNGRRGYDSPIVHDFRCRGIVTVSDLDRLPNKGTFWVRTSGHALIYQDGKVKDWSKDRSLRVVGIYEIDNSDVEIYPDSEIQVFIPKKRTRKTSYCWKLIRLDTGETLRRYKRKPTSQIRAIRNGGYIESLGQNVRINIVPI